jgi:paraquat-inducible protein B
MAHDSKYKAHSGKNISGCSGMSVNVDSLSDLPKGAVMSLERDAKNKVSKQGKHKGSMMYTKRK